MHRTRSLYRTEQKCDCGNIQEIFSLDNKIAVCDPVYPVYVDSNVMAGRTGTYDPKSETWSDVIYMPCLAENGFAPELPKETPDLIYLCFPNNPTGATITKAQLQEWVDYANKVALSFSMMRHTKHIFPNRMCLTVSMNVKEPEPVPSSSVPSPRMPALPECVWALP